MGGGELIQFLLQLLKKLQQLPADKAAAKMDRVIACLSDLDE